MFDFENLEVYNRAKELNHQVLRFLRLNKQVDYFLQDQLRRASISMVINLAEGSGRFTKPDRKNFYVISRGSVYECVSLLEIIRKEYNFEQRIHDYFYKQFEIVSKMLSALINSQKQSSS